MGAEETITVNGLVYTVGQVASEYAPAIIVPEDLDFPPIELKYYAHQFEEEELTISYRVVRENERHPSPVFHHIYAFYRSIKYGSVMDIEYIDIVINTSDGLVEAFRFERPEGSPTNIEHVPMQYLLDREEGHYSPISENPSAANSDGSANETSEGMEMAEIIPAGWGEFGFIIASWNGLFEVIELGEGEPSDGQIATLTVSRADEKFTTEKKMWNRSSGYL